MLLFQISTEFFESLILEAKKKVFSTKRLKVKHVSDSYVQDIIKNIVSCTKKMYYIVGLRILVFKTQFQLKLHIQ